MKEWRKKRRREEARNMQCSWLTEKGVGKDKILEACIPRIYTSIVCICTFIYIYIHIPVVHIHTFTFMYMLFFHLMWIITRHCLLYRVLLQVDSGRSRWWWWQPSSDTASTVAAFLGDGSVVSSGRPYILAATDKKNQRKPVESKDNSQKTTWHRGKGMETANKKK